MKQKKKLIKDLDLNEKNDKRNIVTQNPRNELSNVINLGMLKSEFPKNYNSNTYKNIKLKHQVMKILNKEGKKSKIKDKNGKVIILDKIGKNSNKENNQVLSNSNNIRNNKKEIQEINYTDINISSIKPNNKSKEIPFHGNCIYEKLKTLDNKTRNNLDDDILKHDDSYFNINVKWHKGTISFRDFIKNAKKEIALDNEKNKFNISNRFKERKNSYRPEKRLYLDYEDNSDYPYKNNIKSKNKNNYSFRNSKNKSFFENKASNFTGKDLSNIHISKSMLQILKNSKSTKVILKEDEVNNNNIKNKSNNEEKNNKEIEQSNNTINENKKNEERKKDIFNEIIDEVSQEKNYVQKIVHMKLKEGMKLLRQNSHRQLKTGYNSKTYENPNINCKKGRKTTISKLNNEKDEIINDNFSSFLSNNTENIKSIKLSNSCQNLNENGSVKIKKIKLDKLKNKLRRDSFNYSPADNNKNINISLSLNNKIININNNQKIYAPKKPPLSKKRKIDLLSIPFCCPKPYNNKFKQNTISPTNTTSSILYKKPLETFNFKNNDETSMISTIKPLNDSSTKDLNKIEVKNKIIIEPNINTENNINLSQNKHNENQNIKYILYNKVHITKDSSKIKKNYSNNSRYKTVRYTKKNKDKIKRIEDSLEKDIEKEKEKSLEKNNNKNKIIKMKEIQFGILKKNNFRKSLNDLERAGPINFNLNDPLNNFNKQNSLIRNPTSFSHDSNDITNITNYDFSKKNILISSQLYSNNEDEISSNSCLGKLVNNLKYDNSKFTNNNNNDISNDNNSKLNCINEELKGENNFYNLLDFEDLLIIEDKLNLILIVLQKGNRTFEEYYDLINYFFSSNIKNKLEQIFKYFKKETDIMQSFVNFALIFILICYDFAQRRICINIDNDFNLIEIFQLIYTNILIVLNSIKNKVEYDNKDNYKIRLIELSKIGYLIKDKLLKIDNDINLAKEIINNNTNLIIQKISYIINNRKLTDEKYSDGIFQDIKNISFTKIYKFFLDKILQEKFIGCSVLAYSYLKQKSNYVPSREPYLRGKNKKNYSLVIDLDETLIHFKLDNKEGNEGILKLRPGIFTFLEKVSEFYEIILFAEASEAYIKLMMEILNNNKKNKKYFDYILYRQYVLIEGNDFIKDLNRLGRPLNKTIIIDNMKNNFSRQKDNGILIKPFLGEDKNDNALIDLIPILINIAEDEIDVRNGLMKYRDEILTKITSNLFRRGKKAINN